MAELALTGSSAGLEEGKEGVEGEGEDVSMSAEDEDAGERPGVDGNLGLQRMGEGGEVGEPGAEVEADLEDESMEVQKQEEPEEVGEDENGHNQEGKRVKVSRAAYISPS